MIKYSKCRITWDIAERYYNNAKGKTSREKLKLRNELEMVYGVTEIEVTNILNGIHISDYVNKYEQMSQGIFIMFLNQIVIRFSIKRKQV